MRFESYKGSPYNSILLYYSNTTIHVLCDNFNFMNKDENLPSSTICHDKQNATNLILRS